MFTLSSLMLAILLQYSRFTECECDSVQYFINQSLNITCQGQPCLTFQQFAANAPKLLKNDTVLRFSSGSHSSPSNRLNIVNKERFSSNSENIDTTITCNDSSVFQFNNVINVNITNLTFNGCGKISPETIAVIKVSNSNININHCTFINSKGRIIDIAFSEMTVIRSVFKFSQGIVLSANNATVFNRDCIYEFNLSQLLYISWSNASFKNCIFHTNYAQRGTRLIHTRKSIFMLKICELAWNRAKMNLLLLLNSIISISATTFKHNCIKSEGIVSLENSLSNISNSIFHNNSVSRGMLHINKSNAKIQRKLRIQENKAKWGVLYISQSVVETYQDILIQGNSVNYSTVDFRNSTIKVMGNLYFLNNTGCILIEESQTEFIKSSEFSHNKRKKNISSINYKFGGAITSIWSTVCFKGTTKFLGNKSWKVGGAILATESRLYTGKSIQFKDNSAEEGGALYLDNSNFICKQVCSFAGNTASSKGGAIHAINSLIYIGYEWYILQWKKNAFTMISFVSNIANSKGGGLSLEANAKLQGPLDPKYNYIIKFSNNSAQKGGAIYVDDYTNIGTCDGKQYSTCFFNIPYSYLNEMEGRVKIDSNNGKFALYGGLLDRCVQRTSFIDILKRNSTKRGISYLRRLSKKWHIEEMITSDPVRICFCKGEIFDCTKDNKKYKVKNGETFNVSITAVDQVQRPVNAKIFVQHQSRNIRLGTGQRVQHIGSSCSSLTLAVYASQNSTLIDLTIFADGPCRGIGISNRTILVNVLPCVCPIGFELLIKPESCSCDCSLQLKSHKVTCNQISQSLIRQGDFWINYTKDSGTIHYVIYSHCPYDYCLPSTSNVSVNLNLPNGINAQCAYDRIGLLCSSCKSDLSLSLGSSLCLPCPKDWPKIFVLILLGAMASGIALVMMIFALNLTVAVGTLNGLIFYANIVASNYCSLPKSSFFSVFISWLNLELGIDTCFYKGMDTYSKAWLQFAFPAYLIAVLFMVIIIGKHSSTFAKLIGKRNPIATLATLILLSYTKVIRNIIDIFSVAVIYYYDSRKILWLPDANIEYLRGKHIPLFVMATVIIAIGLAYTVLLFIWQWLLKAPNHKLLRWIRNTRLNLFMDANLAAYNPKHRYWSGLLLLIRVALYLEIAYYNSYKINASILATGLIAACLLFAKTLYRNKVYKTRILDYLDSFSYLNLLILSIAQLYSQHNEKGQIIAAKVSISAAFLQLLFVLTYHTIITLLEIPHLSRVHSSLTQRLQRESKLNELIPLNSEQETGTKAMTRHVIPTSTEIGLSDSRDTSAPEYGNSEEQSISENTTQSNWVETDSLWEPLLKEP